VNEFVECKHCGKSYIAKPPFYEPHYIYEAEYNMLDLDAWPHAMLPLRMTCEEYQETKRVSENMRANGYSRFKGDKTTLIVLKQPSFDADPKILPGSEPSEESLLSAILACAWRFSLIAAFAAAGYLYARLDKPF